MYVFLRNNHILQSMNLITAFHSGYIVVIAMPIIFLVVFMIAYQKLNKLNIYNTIKNKLLGVGAAAGVALLATSFLVSLFYITII